MLGRLPPHNARGSSLKTLHCAAVCTAALQCNQVFMARPAGEESGQLPLEPTCQPTQTENMHAHHTPTLAAPVRCPQLHQVPHRLLQAPAAAANPTFSDQCKAQLLSWVCTAAATTAAPHGICHDSACFLPSPTGFLGLQGLSASPVSLCYETKSVTQDDSQRPTMTHHHSLV